MGEAVNSKVILVGERKVGLGENLEACQRLYRANQSIGYLRAQCCSTSANKRPIKVTIATTGNDAKSHLGCASVFNYDFY